MGNSHQASRALNYRPGSPVPSTPVVLTLRTTHLSLSLSAGTQIVKGGQCPPSAARDSGACCSPSWFLAVFSRSFKLFELFCTERVG